MIYSEKVQHSPVVIRYLMVHPGFKVYGKTEFNVSVSKNSMAMYSDGVTTVDFGKGDKILFNQPTVKLSGLLLGDRTARMSGVLKFLDAKNSLKGIVKLAHGPKAGYFSKKKTDLIKGTIYQY